MDNTYTKQDVVDYAIALGDDALMLGQRLSEWCSNGPFLEEDIALTNVALDFIGRARMFYGYSAKLEDKGRTEDDIAYLRDCPDYYNQLICELPRGDFAYSTARQFMIDAYNQHFLAELCRSADAELAAIAAKAIKETRYHLRRSRDWVLRLGDGTQESQRRLQDAFEQIWGYRADFFAMTALEQRLADHGIAVDRAALESAWNTSVDEVFEQATLVRPSDDWKVTGGRLGRHTDHLGHMLSELQFLQRAYPGLAW